MTGLRLIAETRRRTTGMPIAPTTIASSGLNPKARLLQLCARIGYTSHRTFQRH